VDSAKELKIVDRTHPVLVRAVLQKNKQKKQMEALLWIDIGKLLELALWTVL